MKARTGTCTTSPAVGWVLAVAAVLCGGVAVGCGDGSEEGAADRPAGVSTGATAAATSEVQGSPSASADRDVDDDSLVTATEEDWRILRRKIAWARAARLDTLPVGEAVAWLGATFVGTPYRPGTLELPGPERLVVNLRTLDCVTFVESVLAIVHVTRSLGTDVDLDAADLESEYAATLTRLRYRDGVLSGYPSRLHYFSEWIRDAERKGLVRNVTSELGGVTDAEPVHFMSSNPEAYRQLADPEVVERIRAMEERVSATPRRFVPQEEIAGVASEIRSGDIIAATSTVPGLDVAHTGIAYRKNGDLHLLHAPLVGDSVEISERPLDRRILGIDGQDGILVARPLSP